MIIGGFLIGAAIHSVRAVDPDPGQAEKLKAERSEFVQRKRKDARTWTLTLNT